MPPTEGPHSEVLETIDRYIENPDLVDKQTLMDLRDMIEDVISELTGEEVEDEEMDEGMDKDEKPGLTIVIGKKMRREE